MGNVPQTPSPFWLQTLGFVQRSTKYIAVLAQDPWLCSMFNKIHRHFGSRPLDLLNVPQKPWPLWLKTLGFVECSTNSIAILAPDPWLCSTFHKIHRHFGSRPLALFTKLL